MNKQNQKANSKEITAINRDTEMSEQKSSKKNQQQNCVPNEFCIS